MNTEQLAAEVVDLVVRRGGGVSFVEVRNLLGAPSNGLSIPPNPPSGARVDSPNVYSTSACCG
jgi:hypothetical protein